MWRMTPRLATATLTATLALALSIPAVPQARAASVQSYSYTTSGGIDGPSGSPITFNPQSYSSTLTTPGSFVLGSFTTSPLPPTATLTYNNTPFTIDLNIAPAGSYVYPYYYGYSYNPSAYQYQISGVLNGSITGATSGSGSSSMFATITSVTGSGLGSTTTPPFPVSDLQFNFPQGIAAAVGSNPSTTTLAGQVTIAGVPLLPAPAPEPSTIAVFGLALAGLACRRQLRPRSAS